LVVGENASQRWKRRRRRIPKEMKDKGMKGWTSGAAIFYCGSGLGVYLFTGWREKLFWLRRISFSLAAAQLAAPHRGRIMTSPIDVSPPAARTRSASQKRLPFGSRFVATYRLRVSLPTVYACVGCCVRGLNTTRFRWCGLDSVILGLMYFRFCWIGFR